MSEPRIDKELIKKYLNGIANDVEKDLVEQFMQQEGAREIFESVWEELHQEMNSPAKARVFDSSRMEKWKTTIRQKIEQNRAVRPIDSPRSFIIGRVAIWTILFLSGTLWAISEFAGKSNPTESETEWITYTTAYAKWAVIRLSDSTVVHLGAGSSLQYPKRFAAHEREVRLEGEAFFEVARDTNKPFSVVSGEVVTQVLGTSFKVESFAEIPTRVSVSTGKVRVAHLSGDQEYILAELTAGQQVAWSEQTGVVQTNLTLPTSVETFMSGKLIFEDRPLAEIVDALKRNYNLDIEIQRSLLAKKPIRITLDRNLTRRQMMDVLAAAGSFRYTLDEEDGNIKIF